MKNDIDSRVVAAARRVLQSAAPKAFRSESLLDAAVKALKERYDSQPFVKAMDFPAYVRAYAEASMNA